MVYCLDTNIISYFLKANQKVKDKIYSIDADKISVTVINQIEIKQGLLKNNNKRLYRYFVDAFEQIKTYPLDKNAEDIYVNIKMQLEKKGEVIPVFDMLIAAICLTHNLILVTNDSHFHKISKLQIENWV